MKTLDILVSGRVQGVGFRYYAVKKAVQYNIKGHVKNMSDGRVKIIVTGNDVDLELFLEELKRGPSMANITDLIVNELPLEKYEIFRIVY